MSDVVPLRIAMWTGPRNISTAMLRSWGNRGDTFVCDEPFYGYYLKATQREHPGAAEVIANTETDWRKVIQWLTGNVPEGKRIFFQKQMSQHLLPEIDRGWVHELQHWFLIRDPREMLTSFIKKVPDATLEDTGLPQQVEIFDLVREQSGTVPPVLDTKDVLDDPPRLLELLCESLDVEFTERMLSWPPGRRETDGIWAKHWYHEVETSTAFRPYKPKPDQIPAEFDDLYQQCLGYYHRLFEHRLGQ